MAAGWRPRNDRQTADLLFRTKGWLAIDILTEAFADGAATRPLLRLEVPDPAIVRAHQGARWPAGFAASN